MNQTCVPNFTNCMTTMKIIKKIKFKPNIFFTEIQAGGGSFVLEIQTGGGSCASGNPGERGVKKMTPSVEGVWIFFWSNPFLKKM